MWYQSNLSFSCSSACQRGGQQVYFLCPVCVHKHITPWASNTVDDEAPQKLRRLTLNPIKVLRTAGPGHYQRIRNSLCLGHGIQAWTDCSFTREDLNSIPQGGQLIDPDVIPGLVVNIRGPPDLLVGGTVGLTTLLAHISSRRTA